MPSQYNHYRITPQQFTSLMRDGGLKMNDFLFFTGRHKVQVDQFLAGPKPPWTPTMADAMILELCARNPSMKDMMMEIANEYSSGPSAKEEKKRRQIASAAYVKRS